jgi:restriction system protein
MSDLAVVSIVGPTRQSRRSTIVDAIKEVMRGKEQPLTPSEIYAAIIQSGLYEFHTDDPISIVRSQIRRRCINLDFPTASPKRFFRSGNNGKYDLIRDGDNWAKTPSTPQPTLKLEQLLELHRQHDEEVQNRVLDALKSLAPAAFERFARRLLISYGFQSVIVTRRSRDGGIDGYGQLSVGLSSISAAFQCKRYTNKAVGRDAVDAFRGAVSGLHEQGYFFTTSRFTDEAIQVQRRPGAVPIVLFDGVNIIKIMFDKSLGVSFRNLKIAELALDEVLEDL